MHEAQGSGGPEVPNPPLPHLMARRLVPQHLETESLRRGEAEDDVLRARGESKGCQFAEVAQ